MQELAGPIVAITVIGTVGWVATTWLRIKHGYPLEGSWGQAIHPKTDDQAMQRIALLTSENAELQAQLGSIKDRLATVERIVTDSGYQLTAQIEALRDRDGASSVN
nr:hypothetical protein [Novosphingobium piscinae]